MTYFWLSALAASLAGNAVQWWRVRKLRQAGDQLLREMAATGNVLRAERAEMRLYENERVQLKADAYDAVQRFEAVIRSLNEEIDRLQDHLAECNVPGAVRLRLTHTVAEALRGATVNEESITPALRPLPRPPAGRG